MLILHIRRAYKKIEEGLPILGRSKKTGRLNASKILLVGMIESPHFQKWLKGVQQEFPEKKILIFPSDRPHFSKSKLIGIKSIHFSTIFFRLIPVGKLNFIAYYLLDNFLGLQWRAYFLARIIMRHKPSIIHFHEIQHGAYIFNLISTYRGIPSNSKLIVSTWGSDLTLYSWVEKHQSQISSALSWTDLLTAEKADEFIDAERLGYTGEFKAPIYITLGGPPIEIAAIKPTSLRKIVLIKGYQDNPGRALNVLKVISQLKYELLDFEVFVYSASESVRIQVDVLRNRDSINIKTLDRIPYLEMQELFKRARVSVSMSISDGLPGALVEAMHAGAFPIQSGNTSVAEFIIHGQGGFIVDPWDLDVMKKNLSEALRDDHLVDTACRVNRLTLQEKYSLEIGFSRLRSLYL